jgi:hypothetical protein
VGVLVFLFFLFFIAGHYLGVLLVFNGDTSCFIRPCGGRMALFAFCFFCLFLEAPRETPQGAYQAACSAIWPCLVLLMALITYVGV